MGRTVKRFFLILFFLLVASGCVTQWSHPPKNGSFIPPGSATVCIDMPPAKASAAIIAVNAWSRALKQWRVMKPVVWSPEPEKCTFHIRETSSGNPSNDDAVAWTSSVGGREIFLIRGLYEKNITEIVMHELGHALGAQHVPGTLMDKEVRGDPHACPDRESVAQVAAWNKVDIGLLSWCIR